MSLDALPDEWMPAAPMKRVHLHWTAGTHLANSTDLSAYHILIEGSGRVMRGNKSIAANAPGSMMKPASHTRGANTGAIGVSMCCMAGAVENPFAAGPYPMTRAQWDKTIEVIATLARRYALPVTPVTILTHAEIQSNLGIPQRNKWDVARLPFDGSNVVGRRPVGELMRRSVASLLDQDEPLIGSGTLPADMRLPRFRVSGVAPSTLNFRDAPSGVKKGKLPEGTLVERLTIKGNWSRVRTPRGFVGWVFSDFLRAAVIDREPRVAAKGSEAGVMKNSISRRR